MSRTSVIIASPVQQQPNILAPFLEALRSQTSPSLDLSYVFLDDNHDRRSSELLQHFSAAVPGVTTVQVERVQQYRKDEVTHHWKEELIWRLARMKDAIIEHAIEVGADFLFFIDSDIVLRPGTVQHLVDLRRDVVSEVFWTAWEPDFPELPQVWLRDEYELAQRSRGERITAEESALRMRCFLDLLRQPGTYEVGGLGACTLLSREALVRGARFAEIPNLSFDGEDRHFCVRAGALGLRMFADTHLPPLHLYRESDLARLPGPSTPTTSSPAWSTRGARAAG